MKNWRSIASGSHSGLPASQLESILPVLEQLEASFRPLVNTIPHEIEPAIVLSEKSVDPE